MRVYLQGKVLGWPQRDRLVASEADCCQSRLLPVPVAGETKHMPTEERVLVDRGGGD